LGVRGAALLDAEGGSGMRMEFSIRRWAGFCGSGVGHLSECPSL